MALSYATVDNVKARLGITSDTKDALLATFCAEVNTYIENKTERAIGPGTVTDQVIHGWIAVEGGYILPYPHGLRSITKLEIRWSSDDDYEELTDGFYILPDESQRAPAWPGFELMLEDYRFGYGPYAVRMSASIGWAAIPDDLRGAAEAAVSTLYHARQSGYQGDIGGEGLGDLSVADAIGSAWHVIQQYKRKSVEID